MILLSLLLPLFIFSSVGKNSRNKLVQSSRLKNHKGKGKKQLIPSSRVKLSRTKENPNKIKTVTSSIRKPETKNYQSGTKQIAELTEKIKLLDAEILKIKSDLTQKEEELKTVKSGSGTATTLQAELDQAKKDFELKEKELAAQKEAFDKKELSEKTLQTELKTKTEELEKLLKSSNVSDDLKKENEKLVKKNSELETKIKEIKQLKVKIETLKTEKENLKGAVNQEIEKATKLAQEITVAVTKKMEEAIGKKNEELKEAKEKLSVEHKKIYEDNYKKQILQLEKTIEELNSQLSGKNNTAQQQFEENTKANEARIKELNQKVEPLEKENKELKIKIQELEVNKKVSQETAITLKQEKELLESKIKDSQKEIETLKSNQSADEKMSTLNKELKVKNKEFEKANKELKEKSDSKEKELNILKEKNQDALLWTATKINNLRVAIEERETNQNAFKEYKQNKKEIEKAINQLANKIYYLSDQ